MTTFETYKEELIQLAEKYPKLSNQRLAEIFKDSHPELNRTVRTIRYWYGLLKASGELPMFPPEVMEDINEEIPESKSDADYELKQIEKQDSKMDSDEVINNLIERKLIIKINGKNPFEIALYDVDKLICGYSRYGLNYTKGRLLNILNITSEIFDAITRQFSITKYSPVISSVTADILPDEASRAKYTELLIKELSGDVSNSDISVAAALIAEYRKKLDEVISFERDSKKTIAEIINTLPAIIPVKTDPNIRSELVAQDTMFVVIGDPHFGLNAEGYNLDVAKERMRKIATIVNNLSSKEGVKNVNILFLGDMMQSISGINHPDTWKYLDKDAWGAKAIIYPYIIITEFVQRVAGVKGIYAVGGNHGRMAASKELDNTDEGEKLLFFMLKERLSPDVTVQFHPDKLVMSEDPDIEFILLHGDLPQDKQSGKALAWHLGNSNKFNMILLGHYHHRIINKDDDGINFRKMYCPAISSTDHYAETLGVSSAPGFLVIYKDLVTKLPIVVDIPLK